MWQVCPLCKGKGYHNIQVNEQAAAKMCRVCDGRFIINELTGHPPAEKSINIEEARNRDHILKQLIKSNIETAHIVNSPGTDTNDPLKNVNFL